MKSFLEVLARPSQSILDVIRIIDEGAMQIALVVDDEMRLLGTVTDGDVRRAVLRGLGLGEPVETIMHRKPVTVSPDYGGEATLALMRAHNLRQVPVVGSDGRLIGIQVMSELLRSRERENWVVLMAGGLGKRLWPLTETVPKPMLEVGGRPLLETTLSTLRGQGFKNFFFAVNYKAEMIEDYFGNGSRWGVNIEYLRETTQLGTGGALALLPRRPDRPILVMNGDLLTAVNFDRMLGFHEENRAMATMAVREHSTQIRYGVVEVVGDRIQGITEKPVHRYFINAGIYVLDPDALDLIEAEACIDMPELFRRVLSQRKRAAAFPLHEYWIDIGVQEDLRRATAEYTEIFAS